MFCVLLDQRENTCRDNPVGLAEIMINLYTNKARSVTLFCWTLYLPLARGLTLTLFTLQCEGDGLFEFLQFLSES